MIVRLALAAALVLCAAGTWAGNSVVRIVYLGLAEDPAYEPQRTYTGLSLKDRVRPLAGIDVAMRDTRVLERALGVTFEFEEILLEPGVPAAPAALAARESGAVALLLDLPPDLMAEVVGAEGAGTMPLINIRDPDMRWREADCAPALLHTFPSRAMLDDALAQHLRVRGWNEVLLIAGRSEDDRVGAEAVQRAAAKFGLRIVAQREFELGNDPRARDLNNVALMTGGVDYDVIWLVDGGGEFGRYVPFSTYLARPVIGSEGLVPEAWHWTYERHGAPQLNQRFRRAADRNMSSRDWAAWAAVRAVVESVSRVGSADPAAIADYLTSPDLSVDLYKGAPGNFRTWSGQLRQSILLATHNAVIAVAPFEEFRHEHNTLDTLGVDEAESACPAR